VSGPLDFDDEHGEAPPRRSAAVGARPADRPPRAGGPSSPTNGTPYLWVVGAAAVVLVSLLLLTTIRQGTDRGARGVPAGEIMPPFAVPTVLGPIDADANIAKHADEGQAGKRAACTVRGPDILNGCALREAGPVVLAFFAIRSRECIAQLDAMQRVRTQLPGVQLTAIAIRGDRGDLRRIVRRHRWSFPVGYDRDGALSNAYHVQVCPQLTFARHGGRVVETTFGTLAPTELVAMARRLG
jgi:hypothetical protein